MRPVLDFFSLKDAIPLILLICVLQWVGAKIAGDHPSPRLWAHGFAAAGFLLYLGFAIADRDPATPSAYLTLSLQAVLAMGTARGAALVTLPIVRFLYLHGWAGPVERQRAREQARTRHAEAQRCEREAADRQRAEQERKTTEQRRRDEEIAKRPPPPTREERMATAKERYEAALAVLAKASLDDTERKPAQERVKQQYLRELDEVMR